MEFREIQFNKWNFKIDSRLTSHVDNRQLVVEGEKLCEENKDKVRGFFSYDETGKLKILLFMKTLVNVDYENKCIEIIGMGTI